MEKIAVITPCFNAVRFIPECVESVANSVTLGKFEVEHIMVDDGSTDGSAQLLSEMKSLGMSSIYLSNNFGQAHARNVGLEATGAEWVFFLDADDLLFRNSLRYLWEAKASWVYGDFLRGDEEGKYLTGQDYYGWNFKSCAQVLFAMYSGKHFFQQNNLFRRDVVTKAGKFDAAMRMAEDFDLCTRLLLSGIKPTFIPGPLYLHRYHTENLSKQHLEDLDLHKKDVARIYEKYREEIKKAVGGSKISEIEGFLGV